MKVLSVDAGLSQAYTNYCMKATIVTNLDEAGHEARDIMIVSSHKSECSIRSYATKCSPKKKRKVFDDLSKNFKPTAMTTTAEQKKETEQKQLPDDTIQRVTDQCKPLVELNANNNNTTEISNENKDQNNGQILPYVSNFDEDPLADDNFLKMIKNIEHQNQNVVLNQNVQNFQNVNKRSEKPVLPAVYFSNSTVTINYNYAK